MCARTCVWCKNGHSSFSLHFGFWDKVSHWSEFPQIGWASWSASPQDLPASASPALGLQMCPVISSFWPGCQEQNLDLHASEAMHFTKGATPQSQELIFSEWGTWCHLCLGCLKISQEILLTEEGSYPRDFKYEKTKVNQNEFGLDLDIPLLVHPRAPLSSTRFPGTS